MKPILDCRLPGTCHCKVCVRQPPSLRDAASHVLFRHVTILNICFVSHLTSHSTSKCTPYARGGWILRGYTPQFPAITLWSASNTAHTVSHHLTCPVHGVWRNVMTTQLGSREAAITVLPERSDVFSCMHCSRGLFFPRRCSDHPLVQ